MYKLNFTVTQPDGQTLGAQMAMEDECFFLPYDQFYDRYAYPMLRAVLSQVPGFFQRELEESLCRAGVPKADREKLQKVAAPVSPA